MPIILGTPGNDTITPGFASAGVSARPTLTGRDSIAAGEGNDSVYGDYGDTLDGGPGADTLGGGRSGAATRLGGEGDDYIFLTSPLDRIDGGAGNDTLDLSFTTGDAAVFLSPVFWVSDSDRITGIEAVFGSQSGDKISGDAGPNLLVGRSGADSLRGDLGDDTIDGGPGDDTLRGNAGNNWLHGGADHDLILGGPDRDTQIGGSGADTLDGGGAADLLRGGEGNDSLAGGDDKDRLHGEAGADTLDGGDSLDMLSGGEGDDLLIGGGGADALLGGGGADRFVVLYTADPLQADRILDFDSLAGDRITLLGTGLAAGALDPLAFAANAAGRATTAAQRLVHETDAGRLWFDADGSEAGFARVLVANFTGNPVLTASDILLG